MSSCMPPCIINLFVLNLSFSIKKLALMLSTAKTRLVSFAWTDEANDNVDNSSLFSVRNFSHFEIDICKENACDANRPRQE